MTGNSIDKTNFPHKLLLTDRQVPRLREAFANNSSANINLSKTQMSKITQSGGSLGGLLRSSLKTGFPFMKNVTKSLAKSVLIQLGLTSSASATDAATQKKIYGSGMTTLLISNEEIEDIRKIVQPLEKYGLLIKSVSETIQNEAKEKKGGFLGILLGSLVASSLENLLTGNGVKE